jgi:hypothetical protein
MLILVLLDKFDVTAHFLNGFHFAEYRWRAIGS